MKITKDMIRENVVFHCNTLEKAIELLQKCHDLRYKWFCGQSFLDENNWNGYKENTYYYIHDGTYGSIEWHKYNEYYEHKIVEYVLDKDCGFTKDDLKVGYLVKLRNGDLKMVMPYGNSIILVGNKGFLELDEYNDDLTCKNYNDKYEIIKVYGFAHVPSKVLKLDINTRELLYKKEDKVIEMTLEEVCKELGKEVKIIK